MLCNKCKMLVCVVALVALMAWASSASANIVASYAGPKDFNGSSDYQNLDPVSIGLQGTVSMDFVPTATETSNGTLWYMADGKGGNTGEYRLYCNASGGKYYVQTYLWSTNGYAVNGAQTEVNETLTNHAASLSWKEGSPTLLTVDGVTKSLTNACSLLAFSSATDCHDLGRAWAPWGDIQYFQGSIGNVVVRDTYVPEPSTLVLLAIGLVGLLAYAWRKRR
jgi:hypothetical protein